MEGTAARGDQKILIFHAGGGKYGMPLEWVYAVREEAAAEIRESRLLFRGRELPLRDLAGWLGGPAGDAKTGTLLVIGKEEAAVVLRIDTPGRVLSGGGVRKWPELCGTMVEGVFSGVMVQEGGLVLVLDPEGICDAICRESDGSSQGGATE